MQNHQTKAAAPIRSAFTRPLFTQKIRNFPTLEQASRYIDARLKTKPAYCFNIQQTAADKWQVSRVITGGNHA